ncbi:winged helix-turn-helix transcriptional regulator [Herbiconiux solani]|uniref:winged helix-turn-helix transcriptional regulator n=1 Tax=Herbiconiux solani TaxID=661329 RepID=UPI000A0643E4|nr:helix-turn-helix domain-containing protein [Herbiconiux solani]
MLGILGGDDRCPIARSLDVLGEKWTLMIVRDALAGTTRFSRFQESLGIPREVLTARLATLVEGGVLERRSYKPESGRARDEYVLTGAGQELAMVLLALGDWADRNRPSSAPAGMRFVDAETGERLAPAARAGDRLVDPERIRPEAVPPEHARPEDAQPENAQPENARPEDSRPALERA